MRRVFILSTLLVLLLAASFVFAQNTTTPQKSFEIVAELGRALPRNIVYEPKLEHIAMVDAYGRLVMINALNYQTLYTLHESGGYNDLPLAMTGVGLPSRLIMTSNFLTQLQAKSPLS